jgi:hypothetical protein
MLIELVEDFYFDPDTGTVVRATGKDQCALFPPGASAVDGGFKLEYKADEVVDAINDAVDEGEPDSEHDEEEEDEDGEDDED